MCTCGARRGWLVAAEVGVRLLGIRVGRRYLKPPPCAFRLLPRLEEVYIRCVHKHASRHASQKSGLPTRILGTWRGLARFAPSTVRAPVGQGASGPGLLATALSVLVTRGARARGARARGPRPEARGASARGPRSEVRDCGVSARSQPKVCVTREVANKYSRESILYLS